MQHLKDSRRHHDLEWLLNGTPDARVGSAPEVVRRDEEIDVRPTRQRGDVVSDEVQRHSSEGLDGLHSGWL